MTTISKEDTSNIFSIAERGDRRILQAHLKAIFLVGLTRVGKSTVFNWIQKKPMTGKGNLNSYYVAVVENDSDCAKVGNSLASVTLAPNICKDLQQSLSLVDVAGYEDTRNYVGVIGVSYFLKALFENIRKVKFIIVFDENKFTQQNCGGLIKTFNGFINMFKLSLMTSQIKQRLKQSISLVITKSEKSDLHYDYITEILQKMRDQAFLFENKDLIIELLEYLRDSSRIQPFEKAKNSQQPKECKIIDRFNQLKWQFFDLDQNQQLVEESLISLPFNKDFEKLPIDQKETFKQELDRKVNNNLSYSQILRQLIDNINENWNYLMQNWQNEKTFDLSSYKLTKMFDQVRKFVKANDLYDLDKIVTVDLKVNYQPPSLIESINSVIAIYKIVQNAGNMQDFEVIKRKVVDSETQEEREQEITINIDFKESMERFKRYFTEMIKILKVFASCQEEDLLLEKTIFILQRGFRQFQKLYELDRQLIHDIRIKLTGNCNSVFQTQQKLPIPWVVQFRQKFIKMLDESLLTRIFNSPQSLKHYEEFFEAYARERKKVAQQHSKQEEDKCNIFFSEHRNSIETAKADLLMGLLEKEKACICYFSALKNIVQLYNFVEQSQLYDQQSKAEELDKLSMRKLKLIKKITNVLKVLDVETTKFKKYALDLAKNHNMIEQTCRLYQILIESVQSSHKKQNLYQQYADFCLDWGRTEDATKALQRKLGIQEDSFKHYMQTVALLKEIQNNKEANQKRYAENLKKLGRLVSNDETLNQMIKAIITDVQAQIRLLDNKKELAKQ